MEHHKVHTRRSILLGRCYPPPPPPPTRRLPTLVVATLTALVPSGDLLPGAPTPPSAITRTTTHKRLRSAHRAETSVGHSRSLHGKQRCATWLIELGRRGR